MENAPTAGALTPKMKSFKDIRRQVVDVSAASLIKIGSMTPGQALPLVIQPAVASVDLAEWVDVVHHQEGFFASYGEHLPPEIRQEHEGLAGRIHEAMPRDVRSGEPR